MKLHHLNPLKLSFKHSKSLQIILSLKNNDKKPTVLWPYTGISPYELVHVQRNRSKCLWQKKKKKSCLKSKHLS